MTWFNGWLWTQAIDSRQREQGLQAIYAYRPNAPALLKQYHVAYVVISPAEISALKANEATFRAAYPQVIGTQNYRVYRVDAGGT